MSDPVAGLTVVVPIAPGDEAWRALLPDLAGLPAGAEILLVGTGAAPADGLGPGVRWLEAPRGRARQLNAGARAATRPVLWFLHADSRVSPAALAALAGAIALHPGSLRYFDLAFAPDGPPLMALNAWGAFVRSRALGLPFGDQGFCLDQATFQALGGFDEAAAYGEDHLLVWRARRQGVPLVPVRARLTTSARKYRELGWLATTWRHLRLTARQAWPEWRA